jgi:hypothetical protein
MTGPVCTALREEREGDPPRRDPAAPWNFRFCSAYEISRLGRGASPSRLLTRLGKRGLPLGLVESHKMHPVAVYERTFHEIPITRQKPKGLGFRHTGQLLAQPERLVICAGRIEKPANASISVEHRCQFC